MKKPIFVKVKNIVMGSANASCTCCGGSGK